MMMPIIKHLKKKGYNGSYLKIEDVMKSLKITSLEDVSKKHDELPDDLKVFFEKKIKQEPKEEVKEEPIKQEIKEVKQMNLQEWFFNLPTFKLGEYNINIEPFNIFKYLLQQQGIPIVHDKDLIWVWFVLLGLCPYYQTHILEKSIGCLVGQVNLIGKNDSKEKLNESQYLGLLLSLDWISRKTNDNGYEKTWLQKTMIYGKYEVIQRPWTFYLKKKHHDNIQPLIEQKECQWSLFEQMLLYIWSINPKLLSFSFNAKTIEEFAWEMYSFRYFGAPLPFYMNWKDIDKTDWITLSPVLTNHVDEDRIIRLEMLALLSRCPNEFTCVSKKLFAQFFLCHPIPCHATVFPNREDPRLWLQYKEDKFRFLLFPIESKQISKNFKEKPQKPQKINSMETIFSNMSKIHYSVPLQVVTSKYVKQEVKLPKTFKQVMDVKEEILQHLILIKNKKGNLFHLVNDDFLVEHNRAPKVIIIVSKHIQKNIELFIQHVEPFNMIVNNEDVSLKLSKKLGVMQLTKNEFLKNEETICKVNNVIFINKVFPWTRNYQPNYFVLFYDNIDNINWSDVRKLCTNASWLSKIEFQFDQCFFTI